jgi:hypothetical protein
MSNLLSVIKAAEDIKRLYEENPGSHTFNTIIHGPIKVGKTSMLRTCRMPLLVHSFDPGGTEVLEKEIREGKVIVDNRFESEDPYNPKAFRLWMDEFNRLSTMGFFEHVGTFAIDSITTWQQVIMYEVIRQAVHNFPKKRTIGSQPFEQDWLPQMQYIENYMRKFLALPCDCVLLGHSEIPTDREGNIVGDMGLMVTGKLKSRLPAMFSEIYYLRIKNYQTGEREILTQPTSMGSYNIMAGSRLGKGNKLDKSEKPDFKHILAKVGKPTKDKPLFKDLAKEQTS